jgi:hypothetical protein
MVHLHRNSGNQLLASEKDAEVIRSAPAFDGDAGPPRIISPRNNKVRYVLNRGFADEVGVSVGWLPGGCPW